MSLISFLIAQTSKPADGQPAWTQIVPFVLIFVVLYFFVFRAKRNQDKQRTEMIAKLKPGQRIQTIGGILGVITQSNDKEVTVKVDETNNVKIKFTRNAIHRVLDDEKIETK